MNSILVGLRSNMMDGIQPIEAWLAWAGERYGFLQVSNIYRTEGQALSQGWLAELWAVAKLETEKSHFESGTLILENKDIPIEITLLSWGDQVFLNPETPLPNPDLHRKRVFLQCSAELEPKLVHPILGQTLVQLVNLEHRPLNAEFFAQGRRTLNKG
jgi:7,8-dihydro-6-hydroxymethylpterin-pyrophosphokinase